MVTVAKIVVGAFALAWVYYLGFERGKDFGEQVGIHKGLMMVYSIDRHNEDMNEGA